MMTFKPSVAAIYARYSDESQSPSSIEDQVRRCREFAQKHGLVVDESQVFIDGEISGKDIAVDKREGYRAMKSAWAERRFDTLIVDEQSRLCRGPKEQGALQHELEKGRRIRLITADGYIDTAQQGWQMRFAVQGMMSQEELRRLSHRVPRGMQGQLERGYMVATPAFGYRPV